MKFRTELKVTPFSFEIDHESNITLLGSCFAENIGQLLTRYKFNTTVNPHGILFNPYSLNRVLTDALDRPQSKPPPLIRSQGMWFSYLHHSDLCAPSEVLLQEKITRANKTLKSAIEQASCLFISLGTSWVYELKDTGTIVANCHKVPASEFNKRLLSPTEIGDALNAIIALLIKTNPELKIVFTVSPVRHIKDGVVENSRSKAALISGVHTCIDQYHHCSYFPSYELLMDDLRDYRFYTEDLIHPSKQAIDYCWEKFSQAFFSTKTSEVNKRIGKIVLARHHRFKAPTKEILTIFAEQQMAQCLAVEELIGQPIFREEKGYFNGLLS